MIRGHAAEAMYPEKGAGDYRARLFCQSVLLGMSLAGRRAPDSHPVSEARGVVWRGWLDDELVEVSGHILLFGRTWEPELAFSIHHRAEHRLDIEHFPGAQIRGYTETENDIGDILRHAEVEAADVGGQQRVAAKGEVGQLRSVRFRRIESQSVAEQIRDAAAIWIGMGRGETRGDGG